MKAIGRELSGRPISIPNFNPVSGIGLALGGGFARGVAHVGVLKVLEEENIPVHFIAGTSVGALIGAAYCSGVSPLELEEMGSRVRFHHFARWTLSRLGFASNERMIKFLNHLLKVKTFEELRIPLAVTATDFMTGDGVVFRTGPLVDPVRASCAYPGMFLPVKIDGRLLVDGMLAHAVPTQPLRDMGARRILAVHLKGHWAGADGPRHLFDVIGQCFSIAQENNCGIWNSAADLVIEPDVKGVKYDGFEHTAQLVAAGEAATRAIVPQLKKWLRTSVPECRSNLAIPRPATMSAD